MFFGRSASFVIALALSSAPAAFGASSIYLPIERVARAAPLVVEGRVVRTASGFDPVTGGLSTYITVEVSYVHRGPAGLDRIVLREPGGRVGDLIHAVDAVPVFEPGENVLVFLEPAHDRALRIAGLFFGKLALVDPPSGSGRIARRDLSGDGLIPGCAERDVEEFPEAEIDSVVASIPFEKFGHKAPEWLAVPPEFDRLQWDEVRELRVTSAARADLGAPKLGEGPVPTFVPLSQSYPARWNGVDSSTAVLINVQPGGNPLNDAAAAATAMRRAMAAWTDVPEARIVLQPGDENYSFTSTNAQSPAVAMPPLNIILFNDPYNEITDPSGCSGTLAIGGYWRSGSNPKVVNGVSFFPLLKQYVIFNNNFQCFLGNADNLAEVATHELGHGIGFGHSAVADSIMRSYAYGNSRGPRLGDDDRDGAHCHYPHALTVTSPNGGESWSADSTHDVTWSATAEAGPATGVVDLEYSPDAGATWTPIVTAEPNDGSYAWTVDAVPTSQASIRVIRHNALVPTPPSYPEACSKDSSDGPFAITSRSPSAMAGTAPDGSAGTPLRVDKASGGAVTLTWGASCSSSASDYAIYEGTLSALKSGSWDQVPRTCTAGTDLTETITPASANVYYLVAPLADGKEGLLGPTSSSGERPPSSSACAPREPSSC